MITKIKVLNLYAGIGGNRKLWPDDEIEVTAVEINPDIATIYQDFFPNDKVIIEDAHQYLLDHYKEFDFIWSSPPCQTHSGCNNFLNAQGCVRYPDMKLWQEIVFLRKWGVGKFVVENVGSMYYEPFYPPYESERHYFWSNFIISKKQHRKEITITNARASTRRTKEQYLFKLQKFHGFDLSKIDIADTTKIQVLSNCVSPGLGLHVLNCAFKEKQQTVTAFGAK